MIWPSQYAVFDFETSGLDIQTLEVTEIGLKLVTSSAVSAKTWLLRTEAPVSAEIERLTGITNQMLERDGGEPRTAFNEFFELAKGLPLVGHNIFRFDYWILQRYLKKYCGASCFNQDRAIDTAALYKARELGEHRYWHENHYAHGCRVLEIRAPLKYNLLTACARMRVDLSDLGALHRAGADVEATDRLFRKLIGR